MPADIHLAGADIAPPLGEFFAGDVERRRRNQVIEDDRVLFSPAKWSDRTKVIVVKEVTGDRRAARRTIQGAVNQLCRRKQYRGRNF